ncbi:hypothetical protein B0J14DRAFT_258308 [Halenospora varia]|nr:hypothetical protein B0J14DRAFT_258308 [Halenospora varia]
MTPITLKRPILKGYKYHQNPSSQDNGSSSSIHRVDTTTGIEAMCSGKFNYYQTNNSTNSNDYAESTTATDCSTDITPFFKSPANPGRPRGPFCFKTTTNNGITTTIKRTSNSLRRLFSTADSKSNNNFYEIEEHVTAYQAIEHGAADNLAEILNGHLETLFGVAHIIEYKHLVKQSRHNNEQILEGHINKITGTIPQQPTSLNKPAHIAEYKKLEEQAQQRSGKTLEGHMNKLIGAVTQRSLSLNESTTTNTPYTTPTHGNINAQ